MVYSYGSLATFCLLLLLLPIYYPCIVVIIHNVKFVQSSQPRHAVLINTTVRKIEYVHIIRVHFTKILQSFYLRISRCCFPFLCNYFEKFTQKL